MRLLPVGPITRDRAVRAPLSWCTLLAAVLAVVPAAALPAAAASRPPAPAAAAAPPAPPAPPAKAVLLADVADGTVLWQRNGHRPMLVASTTKILTALVAEETFQPTERLQVPEAAEQVDGTRFGFKHGMRIGRDALLATLLLTSANDAAETLARNFPDGGREGFLAAMQARCQQLGCTDSTWRDPAGLDAPGHRASAADLAIIGRALLARPILARLVGTGNLPVRWNGRTQVITNHNKLVRFDADKGMIGVKTGFTSKSGHTLVAAQRRGGRTLIAVILDSDSFYEDARKLLAWGFSVKVAPEGAEVLGASTPDEGLEAPAAALAPGEAAPQPLAVAGSTPTVEAGRPWWRDRPLPVAAAGTGALAILTGALLVRRRRRRRRAFRLFM